MTVGDNRPTFRVFLSHRYKSPDLNLRLFGLVSEAADVQFEVDRGSHLTSTTRLERMIRGAEGFVGFYSFPPDTRGAASADQLAYLSRYFRLELDMAMRARIPALVFIDDRFHNMIKTSSDTVVFRYHAQEMLTSVSARTRGTARTAAGTFWQRVHARLQLTELASPDPNGPGQVGLVFPDARRADPGFVGALENALAEIGRTPRWIAGPPALTGETVGALRDCDWVVVDLSDPSADLVVAFLRGQAVPVLRTWYRPPEGGLATREAAENVLFGPLRRHYGDVLVWSDTDSLVEGLSARAHILDEEPQFIPSGAAAEKYFRSAALRKEQVFLSYAAEDGGYAQEIGDLLRGRFQQVFDYRHRSIPIGAQWLDTLLASLAQAEIGVILVSKSYLDSGYCMDEGRRMINSQLLEKMRIFPILLDDSDPDLFAQIQYERASRSTPGEVVGRIVARLDTDGQPAR